jgi:hypothetical protein
MHLRHFAYAIFLLVVLLPMVGVSQTPKSAAKKIYISNNSPSIKAKVFGAAPSSIVKQSTVEAKNRTEIRFDVTLGEPIPVKVNIPVENAGGLTFNRISWSETIRKELPKGASITMIGKEGEPLIPYLILPVAVPFDAVNITPTLSNTDKKTISNTYLLPREKRINDTTYSLAFNKTVYSSFRDKGIDLSSPMTFRTLRFVVLRIPLVEFDASSGKMLAKRKFSTSISFTRSSNGIVASTKSADKVLSPMYSSMVINAGDIERFKVPFHSYRTSSSRQSPQGFNGPKTFDTTVTNWIDPSANYIKLSVTRSGLYRLTAEELTDISFWQAKDVRLFNKGKQTRMWIDTTSDGRISAIEFYGERLPGFTREYYNWSTDTNAYWLTNSGRYSEPPLRYIGKTISPAPTNTISDAIITLHHERDYFYYPSDGGSDESMTIHRTDWVRNERFVWRILDKDTNNNKLVDEVILPTLPADAANRTVTFEMFIRGISNTNGINHQGEVLINGNKVTDFQFPNYDSVYHQITIPLSTFTSGINTVRINFLESTADQDKWYVDFYRLKLPLELYPNSDTGIAQGQWDFTAAGSGSGYKLAMQTGDALSLYNISTGERLLSSDKPFQTVTNIYDDASGDVRYVASSSSSFLKPARISSWNNFTILDSSQQIDYIIITHPEFFATAKKLELRRKQAGLKTKVVTTDEVFNAFNFGANEPWAIRRFLHYAFDFYAGTPPSLVTLLGDASWDPKFILNNPYQSDENRSKNRDFVPTYGNPSSDYLYTTLEPTLDAIFPKGVDTLLPDMIISRIPVEGAEEAESYLAKLIEYESQPPAEWNKNFLFAIGGDEGFEHGTLMGWYGLYLNEDAYGGLLNSPMTIKNSLVERTDFSSGTDITHVPDLQAAFRKGQSLVYFFGHGATFITDVYFGDPGTYRNAGLYPIFITLSCRTGAFSEPNQLTLNEAFLRTVNGGVILANGSTGFDERTYVFRLSYHLFNNLRGDSILNRDPKFGAHKINMPMAMTMAKIQASLFDEVGGGFGMGWYNSLQQHSVLGDAAMGFAFRPQPEFNIQIKDVAITDTKGVEKTSFSILDSFFVVKAKVSNFGYSAETPVHISIIDEQPNARQLIIIDTLLRLDSSALITATFPIDTFAVGSNTLRTKIDYDDKFAETNEKDNEIAIPFFISGRSATPFYPPEASKNFCDVATDSVRFISMIPVKTIGATVELEVDTTIRFTNSKLVTSGAFQGIFFDRTVARSVLPNPFSGVIWWRTRLLVPGSDPTPWQVASLDLRSGGKSMLSLSSRDQLERMIVSGLKIDESDGSLSIPESDIVQYRVIAKTDLKPFPVSQITANNSVLSNFSAAGTVVAILTPDGSGIENGTSYIFLSHQDTLLTKPLAVTFDSLIASVPAGRKVIVYTNHQPATPMFTTDPKVTAALQSLGSLKGFDTLAYFGAYALIGVKGSAPGTAKEGIVVRELGQIELNDTVLTKGTSGTAVTPSSAVAKRYGEMRWSASNIVGDSSIRFQVIGEPLSGSPQVLRTISASSGTSADLSGINARDYPKLSVKANFSRSSSTTTSPKLSALSFEYDPAPEFVVEENTLTVRPDSVTEEGKTLLADYTVHSLLCIDGENVPITLVRNYRGIIDTVANRVIPNFAGKSSMSFTDSLKTVGFEGQSILTAIANTGYAVNEQLTFNNVSSKSYRVGRDSVKPKIDVVYDEVHINKGDYVSKTVEMKIRFSDASIVRITDTTSISGIFLPLKQGAQPIFFTGMTNEPNFQTKFIAYPSGDLQGELVITPTVPLEPGRYSFTAFARDASGNQADTVDGEFVVSKTNGFDKVMNWPNPFKSNTYFTFILKSGGEADVKCIVYTVAGRKIRTLTLDKSSQRVGLNKIEWDGFDEDGNEVANGTYLYRLVLNGKNDDGSEVSEALTEKAVKSK